MNDASTPARHLLRHDPAEPRHAADGPDDLAADEHGRRHLPAISEVRNPFAAGDTKAAWIYDRKWLVRWRDETTLMIAPDHAPDAWRPAHIYARGGCEEEFWTFVLVPDGVQEWIMEAISLIDRAFGTIVDLCSRQDDWEGPLADAGESLGLVSKRLETLLGFKVPRPKQLEIA